MNFKQLTYRQKNRLIPFAFAFSLVICWVFAFSKTFQLIVEYSSLIENGNLNNLDMSEKRILTTKFSLQNTITSKFSADSLQWTSNLLLQLSQIVSDDRVGIQYVNKSASSNFNTVERDIVLSGVFETLVKQLEEIENSFFVKSVEAYEEEGKINFRIRVSVIKN
ncbi:hypothetical protein [Sphingobacterium hotanense]|uniref:hypothetical protein n=1 Tax=Sphingobacterium hotanense TaxID=649196 RepID=UPI0021A31031|nr:hypothetical protein [Sphingobacterium hotanense]MCT1526458.1 hypothetical protein [Sphingobacterium hotanense]